MGTRGGFGVFAGGGGISLGSAPSRRTVTDPRLAVSRIVGAVSHPALEGARPAFAGYILISEGGAGTRGGFGVFAGGGISLGSAPSRRTVTDPRLAVSRIVGPSPTLPFRVLVRPSAGYILISEAGVGTRGGFGVFAGGGGVSLGSVPSRRTATDPRFAVSRIDGPSPTLPFSVFVRPSRLPLERRAEIVDGLAVLGGCLQVEARLLRQHQFDAADPGARVDRRPPAWRAAIGRRRARSPTPSDCVNCSSLMSRERVTRRIGPVRPEPVNFAPVHARCAQERPAHAARYCACLRTAAAWPGS